MFRLYYFSNNVPSLVFVNEELAPCLAFIASKHCSAMNFAIISPNNRRITFTKSNDIVFSAAI